MLLHASNSYMTGESCAGETSLLLTLNIACLAKEALQVIIIMHMCIDNQDFFIWQDFMLCMADQVSLTETSDA